MIITALVVPSSQVMVSMKSPAGLTVAASASVRVATVPLKGDPSVAVTVGAETLSPAAATDAFESSLEVALHHRGQLP